MHPLHTLIFTVTPRAAWPRATLGVSRTACSYLPLQQSHLLREEVDNELLAKGCREQVAEGGSHRREHRAQHQPHPWPEERSSQDILWGQRGVRPGGHSVSQNHRSVRVAKDLWR